MNQLSPLQGLLLSRIIEYLMKTSAYNSVKTMSKILRSIGSMYPVLTSTLLTLLLDKDVLDLSYSTGKLEFRLLLLAGLCRNVKAIDLVRYIGLNEDSQTSDTVKYTYMDIISRRDKFLNHNDKEIRKSYTKLVKNLLRGLSATYLTPFKHFTYDIVDSSTKGYVLGIE